MSDPGSTPAFYASRPEIDLEETFNGELTDRLLSLVVEENTAGLYRCEATFGNWGSAEGRVGYLYFNRRVLDFGKPLAVSMGEGDAAQTVFNGRITALEGHFPQGRPPELTVLAEDRFQDLRMTRRTRSFEDVSVRDVIEQVARQHSLRPDVELEGPTYPVLVQVNQSDLAFLRERAQTIDGEIWMAGTTLLARSRGSRNNGDITLTYQQGLREFSALADLAGQRTSLVVSGWDVATKAGIAHEADPSILSGELNGFRSGASLLQSAFGTRAERIVHRVPFSEQEARFEAEAQFRSLARRFVTGRGVAAGDGRIRVGTYLNLELQEAGMMFDGRYYVTEVRHTFDQENGYQTYFQVERPGIS